MQAIPKARAAHAAQGLALALTALAGLAPAALAQGEVNIYSYREPQLIDPLLKAFTDKTGIKANVVYAAAGLNERLAAEGPQQPRGPAVHGGCRPALRGQGRGPDPGGRVGRARQCRSRAVPRPRQALVRAHHARARRLRLQGARQAGHDHLRGPRRPEVEGQDLHPLRPARLQHVAVRHHHRQQGRGLCRGVAARASRRTWRASPPAATASRRATSPRASATWRSATPTTWPS